MDVTVLSNEDNKTTLLLEKTEPSVANALRRTLLAEIPVMAVDSVTFYENTSVMPDEYIAHRISMIPLKTDYKTYKMPSECCGGNCASCSVNLTIDEAGPKMVYSSDMKTSDSRIKPVSGKIPIIELAAGQRLRIESKAILGRGEDHAKWKFGLASYKYVPELQKDNRKIKNAKAIAAVCPTQALQVKNDKLELDPEKCTECLECVKFVGDETTLSIKPNRTKFIFRVETNGQMTAKDAILEATKRLSWKVNSMQSQL